MIYRKLLLPFAVGLFAFPAFAQQASPTPPDDQVVRISTDLIQIDVTVVDKNGKVVNGLGPDDFEVFENGERQSISNLSFISRRRSGSTLTDSSAIPGSAGEAISPQVRQGFARSTIAIVVDDLNLSFASVYYTRKALRQFVDEQMQPDDLVAIIRTGGSVGALQQFTSDKRLLHAAIEKIRWNPMTSSADSLTAVSQTDTDVTDRFLRESMLMEGGGRTSKQRTVRLNQDNVTDRKQTDYEVSKNNNSKENNFYMQSSLGTIRYIISSMKSLPGRKTMMLFSDGIAIGNDANKSGNADVFEYLREVAEVANRSSVVVYTFDTKGMRQMSITASDNTYEIIDGHRAQKERVRMRDFKDSQDGLVYFASRTGGKALLDSNDLNAGIQRALDEEAGYYLLAYLPDSETFDSEKRRFNKLEVRVRRPDLNVGYRSGFFSTTSDPRPPQLTVERQIADALMSPFTRNDIALSVNALYADDAVDGSYIRSFLHIDAKSLKFEDDAEGWKKATFDVAAVTFGDNGLPVESKETKHTIRTKGVTYQSILDRGFVYVLIMPLKKDGVYQYRVAVRDAATGKIGSASQIITVPDLSKKKLALSDLAVENVPISTWQNIAAGKIGNGPGQIQIASTLLQDTVLRQFKAGTVLRYGFEVYNAKSDGSAMPKLEAQAKIFQNNTAVVEGNVNKVDASRQKDPGRVRVSGAIMLKDTLQPGDYMLQLSVVDRSGRQTGTKVLAFEIVK